MPDGQMLEGRDEDGDYVVSVHDAAGETVSWERRFLGGTRFMERPLYISGPLITVSGDSVYVRGRGEVIALDRCTGDELWRTRTGWGPYPSCLIRIGDGLVLVQIGSDTPKCLLIALGDPDQNARCYRNLGSDTPRRKAAAAVLLRAYGDGWLRKSLRAWIRVQRRRVLWGSRREAVERVETSLRDGPPYRDRERLARICVDSLLAGPGEFRVGDPAGERFLCWAVLQELVFGYASSASETFSVHTPGAGGIEIGESVRWLEEPIRIPEGMARAMAARCRQIVYQGPARERPFAASLLVSDLFGADAFSAEEAEDLVGTADGPGWQWAGLALLVKHGERERFLRAARARPADDLRQILFLSCQGAPGEVSAAEEMYWREGLDRAPWTTASLLCCRGRYKEGVSMGWVREPLRAWLERESEERGIRKGSEAEWGLHSALQLLSAYRIADDTPLLRRYLRHRVVWNTAWMLLLERGDIPPGQPWPGGPVR